jgi:hypothetical protein
MKSLQLFGGFFYEQIEWQDLKVFNILQVIARIKNR